MEIKAAPVIDPKTGAAVVTETPVAQPEAVKSEIQGKFAGKSAEEIAKAYAELESLHGKTAAQVGDYSKLGKLEEVAQALDWAKKQYAAVKAGKVIYVDEQGNQTTKAQGEAAPAGAIPASTPGQTPPWESADFEFMPVRQQQNQINAWNRAQINGDTQKYINDQAQILRGAFEEYQGQKTRETQVMIKAMDALLRQAGVKTSLEEVLTKAASVYQRDPIDLIAELAQPKMSEADIEALVAKRTGEALATEKQKWENDQMNAGITRTTPRARLAPTPKNRADEDALIINNLRKSNIRLFG